MARSRSSKFVYDEKSDYTEEYQRTLWLQDRQEYLKKHKEEDDTTKDKK